MKAIKVAAQLPIEAEFDTETVLTELGTGKLVSFLNNDVVALYFVSTIEF